MRSLKTLVPKTRYNKSQFLMVDNIEFIGLGIHVKHPKLFSVNHQFSKPKTSQNQ